MDKTLVIILGSQLLFTASDLLARHNMNVHGFKMATFVSWWFLVYATIRTVATFGQLFIFTQMEVGKTMAMFGATSLVLVNVLGFLLLGEKLSPPIYLGIMLAVAAILLVGLNK
ncbi:hypothetical protein H6801_03485 [Candidatus Nomurabacteria bacterium]|nr:hypothetical protein [Candidatus Nomurabacteria bacterium]